MRQYWCGYGVDEAEDAGKRACAQRLGGRWLISGAALLESCPKQLCKSVDKERYARNGSRSGAVRYSVNLVTLPANRGIVRRA